MPRGGYQKPNNPAPVSGPGKFSRRTDGKVPSPDIDTERGLQYGDRQMLEEAARMSPVAGAQGAPVSGRAMAGSAPARGGIPPWLLNTPDNAPDEPTTAGLDMGAGPGSEVLDARIPTDDIRVKVLQFLSETYGNQDAAATLAQLRAESSEPAPMATMAQTMPVTGSGLDDPMVEEDIPAE